MIVPCAPQTKFQMSGGSPYSTYRRRSRPIAWWTLNVRGPCGDTILTQTCYVHGPRRRSRWTKTFRRRQVRFRRRHPKLPSQRLFNWMGSPPFHRSFALRGRLRSRGYSRQPGFLTGSQSSHPSPLCWCQPPLSLCHHRATRCGPQTNSLPHPAFTRFAPTSSISIHSQCAGQGLRSITFIIPCSRMGLDDIAEDLGFGRVSDYRLAVLEDDLVVAQITKSIVPFLGRSDSLSVLALDQFGLILGAHLLQQYGVLHKTGRHSNGGLAPWQKRRASELLHENLQGHIRLSEIARGCGLSVSHFARSFKTSFGISTHQWLIQHRIDHAKQLMSQTSMSLIEIAIQSGFNDQAAFTHRFHQLVGVSPGRWRRHYTNRNFRE
jgi:AraC-like DNA-binding protein